MIRKIFLMFAFVILICASSFAAINQETVNAAWKRIAKADGFRVIPITYEQNDSPNAWVKFKSQKDFSVHVTTGLMKILNHEDEIAGVLGHEIGHVKLGHYGKGVGRNIGWAVLGNLLGRAAGGGLAGAAAQTAGKVAMNLAESGFSREQEVEADDYGTELLVKAGYPSDGLYRAMKAFKDNNIITQPDGFNSHPPTERRLIHLREKAKSLKAKSSRKK
ncbi:MAG: M48 family metallopeptidase [Synergistaceae bacterium]|nr:M48 family metallopeptidase [Synergistaceae bacterium]MBQ3450303.1 M48 family metallopeptidase [Synergistaceae bacterium]